MAVFGETIVADNLLAGDVLLYQIPGPVGEAIRYFSQSEVNHAALCMGDGMVAEAVLTGLQLNRLADSALKANWIEVRRLRAPVATMQPVLDRARFYLDRGERYAYVQLVMLAAVCRWRRVDTGDSVAKRMAELAIDAAADFVRQCQSYGRQPMICSEFVYRCFDEAADEGSPYELEVEEFWRKPVPEMSVWLESVRMDVGTLRQMRVLESSLSPDFVIPEDLRRTPGLDFAGRLVL